MMRTTFPRRTFLRGAGGAGAVQLALPALNIMRAGKASAATGDSPRRFVLCYVDMSLGGCYRPETGIDFITPKETGAGYKQTRGLRCIFEQGVQSEMGLVSGLLIPWLSDEDGDWKTAIPAPGGTGHNGFHGSSSPTQFGGTAARGNSTFDPLFYHVKGPSFDQAIAEVIAGDTPIKSLPLNVTPQVPAHISFGKPDAKTPVDMFGQHCGRQIEPITSPTVAYKTVFGSPVSGADLQASAAANLLARKSVIDLVSARTSLLLGNPRLGQEDRAQLERHFDTIRTLEQRIAKINPMDLAKCQAPAPVTKDPPPPQAYERNPDTTEKYDEVSGWSNETLRGQIQRDIIYSAFACDQTRVVSWNLSAGLMNAFQATGYHGMFHSTSHDGGAQPQAMADCINWAITPVAELVKKLMATPDFDGKRMIDNTVILVCFEGGWGQTADSNFPRQNASANPDYAAGIRYAHALQNMIIVMAGGKNVGLQPGQHIHYNNDSVTPLVNNDRNPHPAQVMFTAIKQLGYTGSSLGDISKTLPEMLKLG